jgi:putative protease
VGEFVLESGKLKTGDTILVIGKKEGVHQTTLHQLRVNGEAADEAKKGDLITIPWDYKIWPDDKLYKVVENIPA